ncbi:MAG TPA: ABC transporter permease, partial [Flavisolibacter sp.]|nr:ABC transporter permease [Flavisolibacter sp.]
MSRLNYHIAYSLVMARWRQTLIAAIGVCFSITMFIALLSFMTGLNQWLDSLVANRTPHIRLYNEVRQNPEQAIKLLPSFKKSYHFILSVKTTVSRDEIHNSYALIQSLKQNAAVAGVAPKIGMVVLFNNGAARLSGTVNGIEVEAENSLFHFNEYVIRGTSTDLAVVPNSIILGKVLAEKLSADVGDPVYLTTTGGTVFTLKLVGLYQSGINDLDKVIAYTSLATAQKMLGKSAHYITDIQVKLHDMENAPRLAQEYRKLTGIEAIDIQTANAEFATGNFIRTLISYLVGITLLIVAGFGIYNILNMMIYEKMDSIAILKAT